MLIKQTKCFSILYIMKITDKKILNLGDLYFEREDVYGSIEVSIESYFEREETKEETI